MNETIGSLFGGIGGIELGFEREGFKTSWFVESNPYCQAVLRKHWPSATIYGNIKQLDFSKVKKVNILTGGFPCQPHSTAGKRRGSSDERNLWPEYLRAIRSLRPTWVIAENVPGILSSDNGQFFPSILGTLAQAGYDAEWFTLSAAEVGALHKRERIFIVAHSNDPSRCETQVYGAERGKQTQPRPSLGSEPSDTADSELHIRRAEIQSEETDATADGGRAARPPANAEGNGSQQESERQHYPRFVTDDWSERIQRFQRETVSQQSGLSWCKDVRSVAELFARPDIPQPLIRRGSHGLSRRVDSYLQKERTQAIGNAVVPQVAQFIARRLREVIQCRT